MKNKISFLFYLRSIILIKLIFYTVLTREMIDNLYSYFKFMSIDYTFWVLMEDNAQLLNIIQLISCICFLFFLFLI